MQRRRVRRCIRAVQLSGLATVRVERSRASLSFRDQTSHRDTDTESLGRPRCCRSEAEVRISYTISAAKIRTVARDGTGRSWDGPSNMADHPIQETYEEFLDELAGQAYSKADTVGYGEVVQEDALCGTDCVAKDIATAFPCAPFIQYDYPTGSRRNPGMWHFPGHRLRAACGRVACPRVLAERMVSVSRAARMFCRRQQRLANAAPSRAVNHPGPSAAPWRQAPCSRSQSTPPSRTPDERRRRATPRRFPPLARASPESGGDHRPWSRR